MPHQWHMEGCSIGYLPLITIRIRLVMVPISRLRKAIVLPLAVVLCVLSLSAQSNTVQLRNGTNTTTLLPSATSNVVVQTPSFNAGTYYIATSPADPGFGGATLYGATSPHNSVSVDGSTRLFDVSYSNTQVNHPALGARIASEAVTGSNASTGLTLSATAAGAGTGIGLRLAATSPSGSADALHITAGNLVFLESLGATYTSSFAAGDMSANVSYVLPTSDGTSGQFLMTNGSGVLRWSTPSASLDDFTDAKSQGDNFTGSLLLGHQTTGTLSNATGNTGAGSSVYNVLTSGTKNTGIGRDVLKAISNAVNNTGVGSQALATLTVSADNTAVGRLSMISGSSISKNVAVGETAASSLSSLSQQNVAIGVSALRLSSSTTLYCIAVGQRALFGGSLGQHNIAIGDYAMGNGFALDRVRGSHNVAVGRGSNSNWYNLCSRNVLLGNRAGSRLRDGNNNILLGHETGDDLYTGSTNVMIGYQVGSNNSIDTESNLLLVDNSNTTAPLLQGDFTNGSENLKINGDLQMTGGITLAVGADQTVATDTAIVDAAAYSVAKVTSDNDTDADVITITGGNNGMVMYIDFVNTGDNDVTIGGVTHAITNTKSAGITVCRINGTWRVVGIAEY